LPLHKSHNEAKKKFIQWQKCQQAILTFAKKFFFFRFSPFLLNCCFASSFPLFPALKTVPNIPKIPLLHYGEKRKEKERKRRLKRIVEHPKPQGLKRVADPLKNLLFKFFFQFFSNLFFSIFSIFSTYFFPSSQFVELLVGSIGILSTLFHHVFYPKSQVELPLSRLNLT